MKLLMVNDAVETVQTMQEEIPWSSYGISQVDVAYNADEAKVKIAGHIPDILLCDIEMPGDNGITLIRWIRENNYDIDCILLTCHADFDYAREAVSLKCQEYILMPADYETIGRTILKTVHRRQKRIQDAKLMEYGKSWISEKELAAHDEISRKSPAEIAADCYYYILSHLSDTDLNVNHLADHFYMSPVYLNRIFKREKGITLNKCIINERMALAAHLLEDPHHSVVNVAEQVGYLNYPYFTQVFKSYYGCSPTQYSQKCKKL